MNTIKQVAVAGATGNIGIPIVKSLLAARFTVIVLSRSDKPTNLPGGVIVRNVDYDSVESLAAALQGVDAVVSTVAAAAVPAQTKLVDAAVIAGVQRFLPAEYGSNVDDTATRVLPVFASKVAVQDYLKKVTSGSSLTYSLVQTGPFLDRGLLLGFLLGSLKDRKVEIVDGGVKRFSSTLMPTFAKAVASVLHHPEDTKNRTVLIQDAVVTQNQLLNIAKELTPGAEWSVTHSKSEDLKKRADKKIAQGIHDIQVFVWQLKHWQFNERFDTVFQKPDNELLGITTISDEELREFVKAAL
ncbi:NAD(P)-binding protein [Punctularia strigosozonata HHB-11173 SS5]|uniref:NAD(P)-binding protein n=1 Tax=Punctularia strigosozonata (strain HHB-11173) TaxID=741275 RepID=R7S076_PUNST|nr:NAD(P)-binding protein [Punctularia strigosozonata HHB-11173 SS5]EIN03765.1 NAD(P)-binding protein [Punctularia strigosozonata HHB-11173 SS5]